MQNDIIIGMTSTIENRDSNTGGHIQRTSDVINIFVKYLLANSKFSEINKEYWQNLINLDLFQGHFCFAKTGLSRAAAFASDQRQAFVFASLTLAIPCPRYA